MTNPTSSEPVEIDPGLSPYADDDSPVHLRVTGGRTHHEKIEQGEALDAIFGNQQVLYAIRIKGGVIKIGCSAQIRKRRNWIQGVEILALVPGDFDQEAAIHAQLAAHVHHGREWYNPTPEVLAVVNDMRAEFNLDPIAA